MKKILKGVGIVLLVVLLAPVLLMTGLYLSADMGEPILGVDTARLTTQRDGEWLRCGDSYLRQNDAGLWELYATGDAEERGAKIGALTRDLMYYQERVFVDQLRQYVPSERYLGFLRRLTILFNRRLGRNVKEEYRREIAAMSLYCTHAYDAIGTPYERQINYHAAHDIGHMMQQYMLVGCSSFGVWGTRSADGGLLIGRNFDFYVGDDFARNKIVLFAAPSEGYRYASVTWAGMTGVLSGMNERGLTVTLNASKGSIPTGSATPVSLLAREILQYASTIDEAYEIAQSRKTFVSESFLIGSAAENRAAVIEKTPTEIALYEPAGDQIVCTNHFQSERFAQTSHNLENLAGSDSKARYDRACELLAAHTPMRPADAAAVLRDQRALGGKEVGVGNELSLNQSIAHHAVIFRPQELRMWVSTDPWQSGRMLCYNLGEIFKTGRVEALSEQQIEADTLFLRRDLPRVEAFRGGVAQLKKAIAERERIDTAWLVEFSRINPAHYYTFRVLGDYYRALDERTQARQCYQKALLRPIPYRSDREDIERLIEKLN